MSPRISLDIRDLRGQLELLLQGSNEETLLDFGFKLR